MLLVSFFYSRVKLSHSEDTPHHLRHYIFENFLREFEARIWRENLPQEFAVKTCHGYMPCVFCICEQILFCICGKIFFIWNQTFFFFICEILFVKSVSFCYCRGSYEPPHLNNSLHRTSVNNSCVVSFDVIRALRGICDKQVFT